MQTPLHSASYNVCRYVPEHTSKWASWHAKHQCKLQVKTTTGARYVFALVDHIMVSKTPVQTAEGQEHLGN